MRQLALCACTWTLQPSARDRESARDRRLRGEDIYAYAHYVAARTCEVGQRWAGETRHVRERGRSISRLLRRCELRRCGCDVAIGVEIRGPAAAACGCAGRQRPKRVPTCKEYRGIVDPSGTWAGSNVNIYSLLQLYPEAAPPAGCVLRGTVDCCVRAVAVS